MILSRMVYKEPKRWVNFISLVVWAYRTSKRTPTQAMPSSLVYGAKTMVPIEIIIRSTHLALT